MLRDVQPKPEHLRVKTGRATGKADPRASPVPRVLSFSAVPPAHALTTVSAGRYTSLTWFQPFFGHLIERGSLGVYANRGRIEAVSEGRWLMLMTRVDWKAPVSLRDNVTQVHAALGTERNQAAQE